MTRILFDRIFFATDFSPASIVALPYATAIARHFGAKLFNLTICLQFAQPFGLGIAMPRKRLRPWRPQRPTNSGVLLRSFISFYTQFTCGARHI